MKIIQTIFGTLLGAATLIAADKPNIVFILVDDLGYMDIGANNPQRFYETPNIDALAKRGMRFTDGYPLADRSIRLDTRQQQGRLLIDVGKDAPDDLLPVIVVEIAGELSIPAAKE
jgi:hypothetical protein